MKSILSTFLLVSGLSLSSVIQASNELTVFSDRRTSLTEPVLKQFAQETGIQINFHFLDKGMLTRVRLNPTEADVIISKSGRFLEMAKQYDLLQDYSIGEISNLPKSEYHDSNNSYLTLFYRPRVIYASRERVTAGEVNTYEDLIDPKWRGKICSISGYHPYSMNLFSKMAVDRGLEYTRDYLIALKANLASKPSSHDRAKVRDIYEGKCDITLANSYYMPLMLRSSEEKAWGESTYVTFPNQSGNGAYVLRGGVALTKSTSNTKAAKQLLNYLVGGPAQSMIMKASNEFAVNPAVELPDTLKSLGEHQSEVNQGRFKAKVIPLDQAVAMRKEIVKILDEIDFDGKQ